MSEADRIDGIIESGLGVFSKARFNSLLNVRTATLVGTRRELAGLGYAEVSTSSLVNVAGSCENPYASFTLNYYGREVHLSQSAQLQLEALVVRLHRSVFTVNNSFREEIYHDPEAEGRRLSEFTLIEMEKPYLGMGPEETLTAVIDENERVIKGVTRAVLEECESDVALLGGRVDYLRNVVEQPFERLTYDEALALLNKDGGSYTFGDDLGIVEERKILTYFDGRPTFVTHYPTAIKFFNMKRMPDDQRVYSTDLLMPRLGETCAAAVREEDVETIRGYLLDSKIATYVQERKGDPLEQFGEYLSMLEQEPPTVRAGWGIGLERYVGFLLNSNDILETIAYRPTP